jgi:hypothetical protein
MVWQTLAQITETGPKTRTMPRLFCRSCIERIVQTADPRFTPLAASKEFADGLASPCASERLTDAESARAKALELHWEEFLDSTEPFGVRHRFAAGPLTAYDLQKRWVRSGTFNAVLRLQTDFTGVVSRTATPGSDPPARCHREGCERARAPDGMPLKTCARCRSVMYCSPDCQKADWKRHRGDCRLLKAERQINHFERRLHAAKAGFM